MDRGYNSTPSHLPTITVESFTQQSMYHQHTYMDPTRVNASDLFVQEHVSQSSWTLRTPPMPPTYVPGPTAFMGSSLVTSMSSTSIQHHPGISSSMQHSPLSSTTSMPACYPYTPVPGFQYFVSSSASVNSYVQWYSQPPMPSANVGTVYAPYYQPRPSTRPHPHTKDSACQTLSVVKACTDASTQTDLIEYRLSVHDFKTQGTLTDSKDLSDSHMSFESLVFPSIQHGDRRNSEIILPIQRLLDITRVSLKGSDIAERLANVHRQRPCFKKMDTLCARLKQDLLRPDGVLPNINSQGIAWAVKEFIFVFTRIVSSWIILKGFVYNTPDALNKIKDELPSGFMAAFDSWQLSTLTIVEMIIKSFVNLNEMLQKQKNSFSKLDISNNSNGNSSDSNSSNKTLNGSDTPLTYNAPYGSMSSEDTIETLADSRNDTLVDDPPPIPITTRTKSDLNYLYTMIQDSEEAQRCVNANGTYLKTGTYTPLKKDVNEAPLPSSIWPHGIGNLWKGNTQEASNEKQEEQQQQQEQENEQQQQQQQELQPKVEQREQEQQEEREEKQQQQEKREENQQHKEPKKKQRQHSKKKQQLQEELEQKQLQEQEQEQLTAPRPPPTTPPPPPPPPPPLPAISPEHFSCSRKCPAAKLKQKQCPQNDFKPYAMPMLRRDMAHRIYDLSNRIVQLPNMDRFFEKKFIRNYYPYFFERCHDQFIDVRLIILKCESSTYQHIYQPIHDVRRIIYVVRKDLKDHSNMDLRLYTALYERSINDMLSKYPYQLQHFSHITGEPGEKLYD